MKTNITTKVILATVAVAALAAIGSQFLRAENAGVAISYIATVAILGFAAMDGSRSRRLS